MLKGWRESQKNGSFEMSVSGPILKHLESTAEMSHIGTENINKHSTSYMVVRDDEIKSAVEHIEMQGDLQHKAALKN